MKVKEKMSKQGIAIAMIISSLILAVSFVVISQVYFTYQESLTMSKGCYDQGGFPIVEKSGLSITHFDCDMDS